MKSWRENPDSEECQNADRENRRYIGGLKLEASLTAKPFFTSVESLLKLEQVAESWRGTPFMPNAAIKGAGVSCQKLVGAIYKECGVIPADCQIDDGPMSWSNAHKDSLIVKFMDDLCDAGYFQKLADGSVPRAGDMLGFLYLGCVQHCGVVFRSDLEFVHVFRQQNVMYSRYYDATYLKRLRNIWRPLNHQPPRPAGGAQ
jgi:hypothetical protein